ncbi:MAG: hypothetical protein U0165_13400 [Polyangiaceae bacterium]
MPTPTPPVDFRYVRLVPGPSATRVALSVGAAVSTSAAIAGVSHFTPTGLVVALLVGSVTAAVLGRSGGPMLARVGPAPTSMALVPWGVLVEPDEHDGAARVLRWAAIKNVKVKNVHSRDAHGTPITRWSFVIVETERESFVGRAPEAVSLANLEVHLASYARQAARRLSADLRGEHPLPQGPFEPVVRDLLTRAQRLLETVEGIEELSLISDDFRDGGAFAPTDETAATLGDALSKSPENEADPRALAALLAGELEQRSVLPKLLLLSTDVHPLVAACARAAALRMGAEPTRCGALEELTAFVDAHDLETLGEWAHGTNIKARDV